MDIKKINYILKEVLNGNKIVSFEEFVNVITLFGWDKVKYSKGTKFIVANDCSDSNLDEETLAYCYACDYVKVGLEVIKRLYSGDKMAMFIIFHELAHLKINYSIENHIFDEETVIVLKEELIDRYIECVETIVNNKNTSYISYYDYNYLYFSAEVYANIHGYKNMLEFYEENGINLSCDELRKIKTELEEEECRARVKQRSVDKFLCFDSKSLTVDEIFELVISNNYSLLEVYPCFKKEYYLDDSDGKKRVRKIER